MTDLLNGCSNALLMNRAKTGIEDGRMDGWMDGEGGVRGYGGQGRPYCMTYRSWSKRATSVTGARCRIDSLAISEIV